ncbi:MAG: hypothetical protein WAQ05_15465 [Rubrivivax sp.]
MNIDIEFAAIFISLLSLSVSVYIVLRDRKEKRFEILLRHRERIHDIFYNAPALTVDEHVFIEENPDSEFAKKSSVISQQISDRVDKEFEIMCYLVSKGQIDFRTFFDLFHGYLKGRNRFWRIIQSYKRHNHPYTWAIVQRCIQEGFIKA